MDYERVKTLLPPNRRWCKSKNYFYLQRWRGAVRIRYGYRYRSSIILGTWYPNGRFKFKSQYYYPSQRVGLNYFMPDGYQIVTHRYYSFLQKPGEGRDEAGAFYIRHSDDQSHYNSPKMPNPRVLISGFGKVKPKMGETLLSVRTRLRNADRARDMPRRRGRYWLRKARGVYRNNICGKSYPFCAWKKMWPRPTTEWTGECGCHVYTKKTVSRDTIRTILDEQNATVRTAKIQIYGVERFFQDAEAKTINKEAGYELITLDTGRAHVDEPRRWRGDNQQTANVVLTALRMECSTTGKVYVNTVPPQINTVRAALDWIYDIPNYLGRVGKQT